MALLRTARRTLGALLRHHDIYSPSATLRRCSSQVSPLRVLVSATYDPAFNLATEDWIFRNADPSMQTLFLWRNDPTVVIGRNQNPYYECHLQEMEKDGVHLVRRRSGGGAVYQDLGNTNFTFLSGIDAYDPERNFSIVTSALNRLGIAAEVKGRNDIVVGERKVSGSAFKQERDRAFHHGTLLIDVDMGALGRYLNPNKLKMQSKGVKSVRARVANMVEFRPDLSHDMVCESMKEAFFDAYGNTCTVQPLDEAELRQNEALNQYHAELQDWKWRFGETPRFDHRLEQRFDWATLDLHLDVYKGVVSGARVYSDALNTSLIDGLRSRLEGKVYGADGMRACIAQVRADMNGECGSELSDLEAWLTEAL